MDVLTHLSDVACPFEEQATRPNARVVELHAPARFEEAYEQFRHLGRGIELTTSPSARRGEVSNKVVVCGTENIRDGDTLITQVELAELIDQVAEGLI